MGSGTATPGVTAQMGAEAKTFTSQTLQQLHSVQSTCAPDAGIQGFANALERQIWVRLVVLRSK